MQRGKGMEENRDYFSIGELAQRVGVTVRTIQYYDQAGLLSPSAKGSQNRRLYTEENVNDMYRILTLKYMGLSLSEIKENISGYQTNTDFRALADRQMNDIEKGFQELIKRFTTVRTLLDEMNRRPHDNVQWNDLVQTIEDCQDDSQFFWRLTFIRDDESAEEQHAPEEGRTKTREETVSTWHELIADTIRIIAEGQVIDSEDNQSLAKRYLALGDDQQAISLDQDFILMENITPHKHGDGSFDGLRKSVMEHLEKTVKAYTASQNE